jgi:putative hydrolase of the HAD superfamily
MDVAMPDGKTRAVFFDAGETLLHPHPSFSQLFLDTCAGYGFMPEEGMVLGLARELMSEVEERQRGGFTFTTDPSLSRSFWMSFYRRMLRELGWSGSDALSGEIYRAFSDPGNYRLYPDAEQAVRELSSRGLLLGVISNFEPWLEELLARLGISGLFEVICISGKLGVEKPDIRIFRMALQEAGVEASKAWHVGDSLKTDVQGARDAGMIPVLLDRSGRHADAECIRIEDLRRLPEIIDGGSG